MVFNFHVDQMSRVLRNWSLIPGAVGRTRIQMYIDLGESNNNSGFFKCIINLQVQITEQVSALFKVIEKIPCEQYQRAIAKLPEKDVRFGFVEYQFMVCQYVFQDGHRLAHVTAIGNADLQAHPDVGITQGPVQQAARYKFLVGNQQFFPIKIPDRGGPNLDPDHLSGTFPHCYHVSDTNGLFEKNKQTTDEVGDDLL